MSTPSFIYLTQVGPNLCTSPICPRSRSHGVRRRGLELPAPRRCWSPHRDLGAGAEMHCSRFGTKFAGGSPDGVTRHCSLKASYALLLHVTRADTETAFQTTPWAGTRTCSFLSQGPTQSPCFRLGLATCSLPRCGPPKQGPHAQHLPLQPHNYSLKKYYFF
jgi:hypothetical protein